MLTTTMQLITGLPFEQAVTDCDSSLRVVRRRRAANIFTPAGTSGVHSETSWKNDDPQGPPLLTSDLVGAAGLLTSKTARNKAMAVIEFASRLCGSAGESLSRVRMKQLGFPAPELQHGFVLRDGSNAYVDFWFKEQSRVGEFDGRAKYLRADWAGSKSLQDRIIDEKNREAQIRAEGVGFVRWTWAEMVNVRRFEQLLRQARLPQK